MNRDRKVVPINTGRVQIGLAYQPRLRPEHSHAGSRHARKSRVRWLMRFAALALLALAGRG